MAESGLTLMELIVVMLLIGILAAIAVPSFKSVTTSSRMSGEGNALLGDLQYARSEAIREGQPVTVCISRNHTSCDTASTSWQEGWIVFSDANGNQVVDAGTDVVLRIQKTFSSTDTFQSSNADYAVTFTREGFASPALGAGGLTITLHNAAGAQYYSQCLNVLQAGMMSIQTHASEAACT